MMISVAEAKEILSQQVNAMPPRRKLLRECGGLVLSRDVIAPYSIPAFRQSSMDGYAFCFDDWQQEKQLPISVSIPAGSGGPKSLIQGTAARIFTGAPVPDGADTVVMQEIIEVVEGNVIITGDAMKKGQHVRPAGSEIEAGSLALPAFSRLNPAAVGFLTAIGIVQVEVYDRPVISIIVTGDELQQAGKELLPGQVYESNTAALSTALQQLHFPAPVLFYAADRLELLTAVLNNALEQSDVVLLTGGISVGDYDFVLPAAQATGVEQLFHRVKQRPAKPLYAGTKGGKLVFGLPGNPSSALVAFYEYAAPAIGRLFAQGFRLQSRRVPLSHDLVKPAGLTHFLKGWFDGTTVTVSRAQESYRMSSFAAANCLIQADEMITSCAAGELVEIHLLPS
jgi:molybdopterin molybdotransferase